MMVEESIPIFLSFLRFLKFVLNLVFHVSCALNTYNFNFKFCYGVYVATDYFMLTYVLFDPSLWDGCLMISLLHMTSSALGFRLIINLITTNATESMIFVIQYPLLDARFSAVVGVVAKPQI